ncbi:MAG TPA: NUDIX hydrolase [Allosphingosinicella sp.]|nr:NUDIX hydrolase [Allosphingosinicella sp.]
MLIQYGVIPVRRTADGKIEVLLITSRDTRRWVVPRGNPIAGKSSVASAAQEAFEEAGISGLTEPEPLGRYRYDKRRRDGTSVKAEVMLFRMGVQKIAKHWPEMRQRERRWFGIEEAAVAVHEPGLADLIRKAGAEVSQS